MKEYVKKFEGFLNESDNHMDEDITIYLYREPYNDEFNMAEVSGVGMEFDLETDTTAIYGKEQNIIKFLQKLGLNMSKIKKTLQTKVIDL